MTIGEFIRNERIRRGRSQKEFAELIGTTQAHLSNVENGFPIGTSVIRGVLSLLNLERLPDDIVLQ